MVKPVPFLPQRSISRQMFDIHGNGGSSVLVTAVYSALSSLPFASKMMKP